VTTLAIAPSQLFLGDTAAYYIGSKVGRHRLSKREGSVLGT
jgi:membrane protein DedA with SNARE-associated domain